MRKSSEQPVLVGSVGRNPVLGADTYIAKFVSMQGREDEAQLLFQELLPRVVVKGEGNLNAARLHLFYGGHLRRQKSFVEAEKQLELAASLLPEIRRGTCPVNPDDLILEFIALYEDWDKPDRWLPGPSSNEFVNLSQLAGASLILNRFGTSRHDGRR